MAPKSKGRVVDPSTFLPEDDIANLSVEHPLDGRSGRRFNDRYGTYGIGEDGGRRERRREDEDSSRADQDMDWRRGGAPARTESRPMGMRREGGGGSSGGDFGSGYRPRNTGGNEIEINRSGLNRSDMGRSEMGRPDMGRPDMGRPDMGRTSSRPSFAAGSGEVRQGFGYGRDRPMGGRSVEEPEGDWRTSARAAPPPAPTPAATYSSGGPAKRKFNFSKITDFAEAGTTSVKKETEEKTASPPPVEEVPAVKEPCPKEEPAKVEEATKVEPKSQTTKPDPQPTPMIVSPSPASGVTAASATSTAPPAPPAPPAAPAAPPAPAAPAPATPPAQAPLSTASGKPKRDLNSIWDAPRAAVPAKPRAAAASAPRPTPQAEETPVEKKKKRTNEKKAALRAARAKQSGPDGRSVRQDIVRRNLIRGCAQDIDTICAALEPIISADKPLNVEAAGMELDNLTKTLEKPDTVWESTLVLACVHVLIVKEIAAVAEDLMALEGWSDYTSAQLESAVDEKLAPEAEICVRNSIPLLLAAKERLQNFLGKDFEYVNLQEMIKSVAKSGCPRLTPSLTISELVLIAWLSQASELVTPELVVEWSDDIDDDTEGRATALAQMGHLVKWLQGGIAEDKASDSEQDQEESDED